MILPIAVYGHSILREETVEVKAGDKDIEQLIKDMWATMYRCDGIGLAAPQIGEAIRLFVIDADVLKDQYPELKGFKKVFINAQVEFLKSKTCRFSEGCLSVPGIHEKVTRPQRIRIYYYDENFNHHTEEYDGMIARIIQHEYDHVEGKLFVDYLNPLKKLLIAKRLKRISNQSVPIPYKTLAL